MALAKTAQRDAARDAMKTAFDLEQAHPSQFMDAAQLSRVLLAGAARVGLANTSTGARQSYHVEVKRVQTDAGGVKPAHRVGPWFVKVHIHDGWAFLGTVLLMDGRYTYKPSPKSEFDLDSPQQRGFAFLMKHLAAFGVDLGAPEVLAQMPAIPAPMKVWRDATCARCGEALFSEYVALGFGPTCAKTVGLALPRKTRKTSTPTNNGGNNTTNNDDGNPGNAEGAAMTDAENVTSLVRVQEKVQAIRAALPDVDWESDARIRAWLDGQMGLTRKFVPKRASGPLGRLGATQEP